MAIEFNKSQMDGLFAVTAPLEALRLLVSNAATVEKVPGLRVQGGDQGHHAHFSRPLLQKEIAIELREEDGGEPGCIMVGLLQKSLHGTREMQPRTSRNKFRNS